MEFVKHAEAEVTRLSNAGNPCLYSFDGYFVSASAGLCLWCYIMLFDNLQVNYVYWVYTHTHTH